MLLAHSSQVILLASYLQQRFAHPQQLNIIKFIKFLKNYYLDVNILSLIPNQEKQLYRLKANQTELDEQQQTLLYQKLTSCWITSIKEVSKSTQDVNNILNALKEQGNTNRTQIFYKIQADMVSSCLTIIDEEQAKDIISSIGGEQSKNFTELVPEFKFQDYLDTNFNWTYTIDDDRLISHFKVFENWISGVQTKQQKQAQEQQVKEGKLKDLKDYLKQLKQDKLKEQILAAPQQQAKSEMNSTTNYILASIAGFGLLSVCFWIYRQISKAGQENVKKQKNKTKQQ
ncbi:hypothetical protein pb186bvf_012996 [Paramecium bursaria]